MISENFKEILDKYETKRNTEDFKDNPFAKKIKTDFKNEIKDFIETFVENKELYHVKGDPGQYNWVNNVQIKIGNYNSCKYFKHGLYILYVFNPDGSGVYLTLNQGNNFPDEKTRIDIGRILYDSIELEIPDGFSHDHEEYQFGKQGVLIKYYEYENLDEDILKKDLKALIKIYEQIIPVYLNLICRLGLTPLIDEINRSNNHHDLIIGEKSGKNFLEYLNNRGFFFDKKTIENYLLSLKVKPFIILSGNSGTGKTKLSQLFAEYLYQCNNKFYSSGGLYEIVPVGSNWTENRNVVGYYNVLTKEYQHTQSLDLLLDAGKDKENPYFLILDEMNLSHVERYFSDFLSAMESDKPIPLHRATVEVDVPTELKIPENVFIVGTVNVDETTYMFSPKVLDRANVLEFKTFEQLSISDYVKDNRPKVTFKEDVDYLENVLSDKGLRENILSIVKDEFSEVKFKIEIKKIINEGDENEEETTDIIEGKVLDEIIKTLTQINEYLKGSGFEFGYRTVNEILSFMYVAWKYERRDPEWDNWKRYLDAQILQKILPKLHGSQMVLSETLDNLLTYCLDIESVDEAPELKDIDERYPYPNSAKKLIQMKEVLEKQRYVSFIN